MWRTRGPYGVKWTIKGSKKRVSGSLTRLCGVRRKEVRLVIYRCIGCIFDVLLVQAPVLVDYWLENFRIHVEARSGALHLEARGELLHIPFLASENIHLFVQGLHRQSVAGLKHRMINALRTNLPTPSKSPMHPGLNLEMSK